jgi:hypothetical protein
MKWIITRDLTESEDDMLSAVGFCHYGIPWPYNTPKQVSSVQARNEFVAEISKGMNYEFRLLDDDGNAMVEGLCLDLDQQDGDSAFDPLDRFETVYGATMMEYRVVGEAKWEQL